MEGNNLLHGIVIEIRPFIVILEYDVLGEKMIRKSEICFESEKALEDIDYLSPIKRFGFEIGVNDKKVYFNGEEAEKFIEKHRLENLVKESFK